MNTVWVGLDNIYGNILSHKMTRFTIQIQVLRPRTYELFPCEFSQKQKSYKKVFQPLNEFLWKGMSNILIIILI